MTAPKAISADLVALLALAAIAIAGPIGMTWLTLAGLEIPQALAAISGSAVGSLSTFLLRSRIWSPSEPGSTK